MKTSSSKLKIILVIIGLSIFTYAEMWGADWKYLGGRMLAKDEEAICFYGSDTVERLPNGNVRVWTKTITDRSEFKRVQLKEALIEKVADKLVSGYYPPYVLLHQSEINHDTYIDIIAWEEAAKDAEIRPRAMVLFEVNCKDRMIRTLSTTLYDNAGVSSIEKGGEWHYVSPESNGDTLRRILCPQK